MCAAFFPACATVHTETIVDAPASAVWRALLDADGYSSWNPVLIPQSGALRVGETVTYTMTGPGTRTSTVKAKVVSAVENRLLQQRGGIPGVLTFNHAWRLEPHGTQTRVIQHEEYSGLYVPFWNRTWVEPAYAAAGAALKAHVERAQRQR